MNDDGERDVQPEDDPSEGGEPVTGASDDELLPTKADPELRLMLSEQEHRESNSDATHE